MLTVGNNAIQIIAYILVMMLCAYGGGRVHQWYKHTMDRDQSFRDGYNHGYRALFALAARRARPKAALPKPSEQRDPNGPLRD
ncbi:hypothetical protein BJ973_007605 [Actinoplanes tereljensis]|uniref:Uncharacterized protein n=1 Tax=Paractinoplanes tereljensis TaxID=571912 RepID=A0A919NUR4_9ACTN|nr:hypothetical protein [Actinoplanes tereljensis]GIF24122.1 hypothetical protein Ate02nite_68520 [Actinoplanes tereljensis]